MKKTLLFLLSLLSISQLEAQTIIVDVTNPTTGATWMDRNLGATQAATSSTDVAAYGDYYQWGRDADGHQFSTSSTTITLSNSSVPGHSDFILNQSGYKDWQDPQNDNLWQGVNGTNNPCPSGYRLPTAAEFIAEVATWSSQDYVGAFNSILKLPVSGFRSSQDGTIGMAGTAGFFLTSNLNLSNTSYLAINASLAGIYDTQRANGLCIRCIKDATAALNGESKIEFSVYPNPASDFVTIRTDEKIVEIQLFNIAGELVQTETQNSFSIEQLTNGIYLINIKTDSGTVTKRLIKE